MVEAGERALSLMAGRAPDLVVLDLHLPDVPGVEALRRIRADARLAGMPVIVTTAYPQMAESLWEEADVVLIKPISSAVLKRKAVELARR